MTVGAILLAAGSARRMGADKLLADLDGRPLAGHAFDAIRAAGLAGPIVAVAPASAAASLFAGGATTVEVADHGLGMGHSLAAAVRAAPADWKALLVCLADMPFVRPETLRTLADLATEDAIVRPAFDGQPGNPLLWGREHFPLLASLEGDRGGRDILRRHSPRLLDVDDPGVLFDIDMPDALERARRFRNGC